MVDFKKLINSSWARIIKYEFIENFPSSGIYVEEELKVTNVSFIAVNMHSYFNVF